ncbi:REL1 protein [Trypanosoma rangeli]|uniref:RNA ligase (ATP) n=1 Tax=Trypanosoma rangeli TaxID=5698 RepID=A0A422NFE4_TRYRA|nr:REL1 protein [Trypanosoma rangeli]RNF04180.1 REL1 protein [Trypanosoma rangeli]|eukprot:RNF04180.1 REL1 protein [Trypanosoma rangeli]
MRGRALVRGLLRRPSVCALLGSSMPRGTTIFAVATRPYMPLPNDQSEFSPYIEIDLPSESRIQAIHKSGLGAQEWVACEKVHGTNFGIYLINLGEQEVVRFSKRSGIMDPNENFFGYHILIDEFSAQVRILCDLLKQKYGLSRIGRVVLNGELFGAKYKHPLVPKSEKWCTMPNGKRFPIAGVEIQREPFPQYSPELHFFAFDIKYSVSGAEEDFVMLGYDEFVEFCSKVPNLLYAKAVVRGTLDTCLAFDVENFNTPLPALLGLGNYPLEGNLAEGVVIRHVRRGDPAVEKHNVATILKLRCSSFMELKHPGKQKELKETFIDTVRTGALQRVRGDVTVIADSMLPQVEAAANNLLLNNVSDGRLSNVLSKIGREPLLSGQVSEKDVALMLAKDALKDFLKEVDVLVLNTSLSFRKMLISNVYFESNKLVAQKWKELIKEEAAAQQEAETAALREPQATA